MQLFIPINKLDEEQHMVYGYASTPDLDTQGDIVTIDALKGALPDYMQFPTIREMHDTKAIGVTKQAEIQEGKGLFIGAKIVDKEAWEKVKEGVYRAFSIGGKILKQEGEKILDMILTEISLVDSPANKAAVITVYKREDVLMTKAPKALVEAMKKYAAECVECEPEELMHESVMDASDILRVACQLAWTRYSYAYAEKPTEQLDAAIEQLKSLAITLLTSAEYGKMAKVLETVGVTTDLNAKHIYDFHKVQGGSHITLKEAQMAKKDEKKEVTPEVTPVVETAPEAPAAPAVETPVVEAPVVETPAEPVAPEATPAAPVVEPEAPVAPDANAEKMAKLDAIEATLDGKKEEPAVEKVEEPVELTKVADAMTKMATKVETLEALVEKQSSILEKMAARMAQVEAQPAAPKTTATFVVKKDEDVANTDSPAQKRIDKIDARLAELTLIRENDVVKYQTDHQAEAVSLMEEKNKLIKSL